MEADQCMFGVKTWIFIVLQGVTGAFPWPAMSLLLYWFQLLDINPFLAILVSAGPAAGAAIGGGIGGCIGDRLNRTWSKKYARTAVSHFSVVVGPFLMIIMFFVFPQREESWWMFGLYGLFAGMFISWSAALRAPGAACRARQARERSPATARPPSPTAARRQPVFVDRSLTVRLHCLSAVGA